MASLYLFHPVVRNTPARENHIPILMYHSIGGDDKLGRHPYYATSTSPRVFGEQMKLLRDSGYSVVNLSDVGHSLDSRMPRAKKVVAITFDDGYRDFLASAFPILSEYGFTATVFLPTAFIGDSVRTFQGKECLTWGDVKSLRKAGMSFGSHTVNHPELKHLKRPEIEAELRSSKMTIEERLGEPIRSFSYPFAFPEANRGFTKILTDILQSNGYEDGVSTIIGTARRSDNSFFRRRLPVNTWDDPAFLRAKLEGGYDWLGAVQYWSKKMRRDADVASFA
jgi:peptidoglycan/xylan/chitin deacetylase (PgdA/CDA1 family)